MSKDGPTSFQIRPRDYYRLAMTIGHPVRCRCDFGINDKTLYASNAKWSLYLHYYCDDCLPDDLP